jgi:type IV secretion system protein VirD4
MLARSTFKFSQLKERICTVYLCSNIDFLDVNQRTARLIVTCAISELQRPDIRKKVPVWMLCDEAYHYGYMASIEAAYGAVRGAGVRLCTIWTDLAQIEKRYGGMSRTILGNSGATVMMATGDDRTAEHISKLCGLATVVTATPNVSLRDGWPQVSWGKHISQEPLLPAHAAMLIPANRMLVFIRGLGPVLAKKVPYFKTALKSRAGRNPYYQHDGFMKRMFGR